MFSYLGTCTKITSLGYKLTTPFGNLKAEPTSKGPTYYASFLLTNKNLIQPKILP